MLVLVVLAKLNKMDIDKFVKAVAELRKHLTDGDYEISRVDGNQMKFNDFYVLSSITSIIDEQLEKFEKEKKNDLR